MSARPHRDGLDLPPVDRADRSVARFLSAALSHGAFCRAAKAGGSFPDVEILSLAREKSAAGGKIAAPRKGKKASFRSFAPICPPCLTALSHRLTFTSSAGGDSTLVHSLPMFAQPGRFRCRSRELTHRD